ncbi:D-alanyl-D-alanine carboxypeptidase/D-alanyl-D-alanine-endopeptidase [[Limnothrix rosea] IAM M-220]|nr:D-alanyl-D-alanine carboxypeptidase/D-alanyl-D-alanine-endopeptidase [[Limnothrix rosea] IAM M-220]
MFKQTMAIAAGLMPLSSLVFSPIAYAQVENTCNLEAQISNILNSEKYNQAQWGIAIQDLTQDTLVYGKNANTLFVPASNAKLFTTAAALEKIDTDYQFATKVYAIGYGSNLEKLIIRGGGDPTADTTELQDIVALLKSREISAIEQVIVDDSLFPEPDIHPTWEWSDLAFYYAPPVNSLMLDKNTVALSLTPSAVGQPAQLQTLNDENHEAIALSQWQINNQLITSEAGTNYQGSVTQTFGTNELVIKGQIPADADADIWRLSIPNPTQNVMNQLLYEFAKQGIQVNRSLVTNSEFTEYDQAFTVTTITSPSLSGILGAANRDSSNLEAESLRHFLGTLDPEKTGAQVITETLIKLGVTENSFVIKDGSGLSRHNLASPRSLVELLAAMADHPDAEVYQNSLAIAAETGTLSRRFVDTPMAGNFYGKTGTMTNVVTLSGYLELDGDRTLALSILANQSPQPASITRQGIDDIIQKIHHWGENCLGTIPTAPTL